MSADKRIRPAGSETDSEVLADSTKYPTGRRRSTATRVGFVPVDILGCVRIDVNRPRDGERFDFGEVGRRIFHAAAGLPAGVTLQLVVSPDTPTHDVQLPAGARVQVVAPDAGTLKIWLAAISAVSHG